MINGHNGGRRDAAPTTAHGAGLILVGHEEPVSAVTWDPPEHPADSGYVAIMADRLDDEPDEVPDEEIRPLCTGCAITRWPDLQTALAIARQHGAAELDEHGSWQPA